MCKTINGRKNSILKKITFFVANANDNVTAKGNPSGIAITTIATPMIKKWTISAQCSEWSNSASTILSIANLMSNITTIATAEINPNFPISSAIFSNFSCKGVALTSSDFKDSSIFPWQLSFPTTITRNLPSPPKI